ncbi:hypothetical protein EDWATA_00889 [Edwardsiella tarda ATCC 23685]|uniref:Uncharacterized protein n=1 Tax=Edwardsiella tarda ATCC 23685 TaxID=500638 RepID=D4F2E2_EDWTA|nr:hypothetical protein EDWATA_00889 [Edwardsiella tarda ATCC 23685]
MDRLARINRINPRAGSHLVPLLRRGAARGASMAGILNRGAAMMKRFCGLLSQR